MSADPTQRVAFGTSGHRGTAFNGSFNEAHILAITQAVCEYRAQQGITGPLFLGKDTHALSEPAQRNALEVLAANGVDTRIQADDGYTPTPVISRAILVHNADRNAPRADGIVITPSHNPPQDGGIKYNPPHGGPADTDATGWIEQRANALMADGNRGVKRLAFDQAIAAACVRAEDFAADYIADLAGVIDMEAIRKANLRIGVDPLGGAAVAYWQPIAERYGLNIEVVNPRVDPAFAFMTLDHDGKIRMDCSSPYAMASLVKLKDRFDIAWGNDADVDRHGIVTPSVGLMNPNHYLAVAIHYLLGHRPQWPADAAVGKTLVSSGLIDRVVNGLGRRFLEVPGRLQVVLGRAARRRLLLRRRGKRRRELPAPRRQRLDHRQGRHHPRPARRRDHRRHRQGSGPPLPGSRREIRHAVLRPHRRPGQPGAEGRVQAAHRRARRRHHPGRRAHRGPVDAGPRQRRADRRLEGGDGQRLVCRPAVRHRGHLQALRRELQECRAPATGRGRGAKDRD